MNSIMQEYYPVFELYQGLRNQLMDVLSDQDLHFRPDEKNLPLGILCREIGETQQAYIDSFKSFELTFDYRNMEEGIATSVERLSAWYATLDQALREAVAGLSEEQIQGQLIDRGGDFQVPPLINLDIYKEALIIFYGKASIYLQALEKLPSQRWRHWIG
ncbi:MAG: hypothetical protein R3300_15445 [Candidatus Promineifilaceae bacterium]|nr:hypothetical protein [Candidatus Promineifilaceae bacterium]